MENHAIDFLNSDFMDSELCNLGQAEFQVSPLHS